MAKATRKSSTKATPKRSHGRPRLCDVPPPPPPPKEPKLSLDGRYPIAMPSTSAGEIDVQEETIRLSTVRTVDSPLVAPQLLHQIRMTRWMQTVGTLHNAKQRAKWPPLPDGRPPFDALDEGEEETTLTQTTHVLMARAGVRKCTTEARDFVLRIVHERLDKVCAAMALQQQHYAAGGSKLCSTSAVASAVHWTMGDRVTAPARYVHLLEENAVRTNNRNDRRLANPKVYKPRTTMETTAEMESSADEGDDAPIRTGDTFFIDDEK